MEKKLDGKISGVLVVGSFAVGGIVVGVLGVVDLNVVGVFVSVGTGAVVELVVELDVGVLVVGVLDVDVPVVSLVLFGAFHLLIVVFVLVVVVGPHVLA